MVRKVEPGKTKLHLVAQHNSGTIKLYRREDDGKLIRVTQYPKGKNGHLYVTVPETFLHSVRGWQTWEVFEGVTDRGKQTAFPDDH